MKFAATVWSAVLAAAALVKTVDSQTDSGGHQSEYISVIDDKGCKNLIHLFHEHLHKSKYRVGVYDNEGDAAVYSRYNLTFSKYLTATAGKKFDPPIEFEIVPVNLAEIAELEETEDVDFFFATPAAFSCIAAERGAQPLVTGIAHRTTRGLDYDLDVFGGVIFTLADNNEVNIVEDLKDKIIGAGGVTMTGGGQVQFYEMIKHGLSYVADPKMVVFTKNEEKTVQGVLDGDFEVGFCRTDQIERHILPDGTPLDPEVFKVISPKTHVLDDGSMFPFLSSTDVFPEWALSAMRHVHADVSEEVQSALLALHHHARSLETGNLYLCETTPELSQLAKDAQTSSLYNAFRTIRSYSGIRTMQEAAGFLRFDSRNKLHCIRGETLYQDIQCPDHHYKVTKEEFSKSCELAGLECKEEKGYECFCKPCIKAFEVDVVPYVDGLTEITSAIACDKMSLCGEVEQRDELVLRLVDNVKREDPEVMAILHFETETLRLMAFPIPDVPYNYEFRFTRPNIGVGVMEIFFDAVQIPESPVRVKVIDRDCKVVQSGRVPDESGNCVCSSDTVEIQGSCIQTKIFVITGTIGGALICGILGMMYLRYRTRKADEMWRVNLDEIHFDDPPEIIGQGSFGVVLLAEYRGTKVAIKRAVKDKRKESRRNSRSKGRMSGSRKKAGVRSGSDEGLESYDGTKSKSGSRGKEESEENDSDDEAPEDGGDIEQGTTSGSGLFASGGLSGSKMNGHYSVGFLQAEYTGKRGWGWGSGNKHNDYHMRFKESILGTASGSTGRRSSIHRVLCPWFDEQARQEEEFVSEMRVLSRLRHPCITTVMGAIITGAHDPMLVMEYMDFGSLHDLLSNDTMYLSGDIIMQVVRDLAQGLRYLHSSRPPILHGDLKAKNILVDNRFRAKLCDFGLSTKASNSISGTPFWLAPEYLRGEKDYDTSCDIYSVGIIFYEIYARKAPYHGEDYKEVLRKVCNRRINKRPDIPACMPEKCIELTKKLWSPDANFRLNAKDLDTTLTEWTSADTEPVVEGGKARRTEDMLYQIFPKHIADALKNGQKVEPETHEEVTVVFSDIIHFTDISRDCSALKVSQMLDRLYLAFDRIAKKHGVFKVETIGDAYMGVTNLLGDQTDTHVKRIAEFAVDMVQEANQVPIDDEDLSKGNINIRVGFHSGPVVSNVIGSTNPRYGLFGDTVNTASRMESNSHANKILCSEKSYKILKEQSAKFPTRRRGKINVKGKGDMVTFWVGKTGRGGSAGVKFEGDESSCVGTDSGQVPNIKIPTKPTGPSKSVSKVDPLANHSSGMGDDLSQSNHSIFSLKGGDELTEVNPQTLSTNAETSSGEKKDKNIAESAKDKLTREQADLIKRATEKLTRDQRLLSSKGKAVTSGGQNENGVKASL